MSETVAAATARALAAAGIDRVFGLPGGEVLVLIDELRRAGVDFVLMRHEANAGIAAAVYGKLRRRPGVVLTTLGPGAANLMLPLGNAYLDQEPLLALSAQIPDDYPASHTHQLLPLHDVYRPVTRLAATITCENAADIVPRALTACLTRPFGTAYLTLSAREALRSCDGRIREESGSSGSVSPTETVARPISTSASSASPTPRKSVSPLNGSASPVPPGAPALSSPASTRADAREHALDLVRRLAGARRPLVAIGLGIDPANAPRIRQWITDWRLPVVVTPKVKGIVDETDPTFVGVIGGMAADGLMCEAHEASDLLLRFGLDPVEIDKTWHAERPIHWILEAPNVGGLVPAGTALVDHVELLDALLAEPRPGTWIDAFKEFQQRRRDLLDARPTTESVRDSTNDQGRSTNNQQRTTNNHVIWPGAIINALADVFQPETIVTTDVGSHKYLFGQFWPSRLPETFWMSNGLSGMAYGLSAAIGAKLARPDAPVLAAVGDGGFSMNAQELETAERVGVPFVTVVLEDCSYSLIKLSQEGKKLAPYRTDFAPIDTVKMAEACGVEALRTRDPKELAAAARRALEQKKSLVIAVP